MQWLWIVVGVLILGMTAFLTRLISMQTRSAPNLIRKRPKLARKPLRLLRRICRTVGDSQDLLEAKSLAQTLAQSYLQLRRSLRATPRLTAENGQEIRLLSLAEEFEQEGEMTPTALLDALGHWDFAPPSSGEAYAFPFCIAVMRWRRLTGVLEDILADARQRNAARDFAQRLRSAKSPAVLLAKAALSPIQEAELLSQLRLNDEQQLIALVEESLHARELSPETLAVQDAQRQLHLAEELRQAEICFRMLASLDWIKRCDEADLSHRQLLKDPSGTYRRMTTASRLHLRLQAEAYAYRVGKSTDTVLRQALALSHAAEPGSLESYIGFWFQHHAGLTELHKALNTRKGVFYARLHLQATLVRRLLLWICGITSGFLFLHTRGPVFMLPFFCLTAGALFRALLPEKPPTLPRIDVTSATDELRTLVVLPAVLNTPGDAIGMVRCLKRLRHTFPEEEADYLLLGDFGPSMTAVSAGDQEIIAAACAAVNALEDPSYLYIQRQRAWDDVRHLYAGQDGAQGALREVCRLIVHGECTDVLIYASIPPGMLERRYAYILTVSPDCTPAPGMLHSLLQVIAHPICTASPLSRGISILLPATHGQFSGTGLLKPAAYLEATDGLLTGSAVSYALIGELGGAHSVPDAQVQNAPEDSTWKGRWRQIRSQWSTARWQLPWVNTPSGLIRNPLNADERFRLREMLRSTLAPTGQCFLLIYALITTNWPLLLLSILGPELGRIPGSWGAFIHRCCQFVLLPMRAALPLIAFAELFRQPRRSEPEWISLEAWIQGLFATLLAAIGIAIPSIALPALVLSAIFACFPLAHRLLDIPPLSSNSATPEDLQFLEGVAQSTWRYFSTLLPEAPVPLCTSQYDPPCPPDGMTSPEAIASVMLACISAKELGFISADRAAEMLQNLCDVVAALPMPMGVPCRRYQHSTLKIADAHVETWSVGYLYAALLTSAQALRSWLPEIAPEHQDVSTKAEITAQNFDLLRLYDLHAGLFYGGFNADGQPESHMTCMADSALISIAACARRLIPPSHFANLSHTRVRLKGACLPLSSSGSATSLLLAGVFLPIPDQDAEAAIRAMKARGHEGLLGQGDCCYFSFDAQLRYKHAVFGLQEAALHQISNLPVYAPYAAALALPFAPHMAAQTLIQFHSLGALGASGFCDAVDFTHGTSLIGLHDTFHQGLILACTAGLLADSPMRRFFCGLPEVEACLPLLQGDKTPILLPNFHIADKPTHPTLPRIAELNAQLSPPEVQLLGTDDFRLLADAHGNSAIYDLDVPLTASGRDDPFGLQFYLVDEENVYRLGAAGPSDHVTAVPGEFRIERSCGSVKTELFILADTLRRRVIHMVTLTNMTTHDKQITLADLLLPDLNANANALEASLKEHTILQMHHRGTSYTLFHTVDLSAPPHRLQVCLNASDFLGRSGSMHRPASLLRPGKNNTVPGPDPCLSFRLSFVLGGRGQITAWFTTGLEDHPSPSFAELAGIRQLAALQHTAMAEELPMTSNAHQAARLLAGIIFRQRESLILSLEAGEDGRTARELLQIAGWFNLHGFPVHINLVCPQSMSASVQEMIRTSLAAQDHIRLITPEDAQNVDGLYLNAHDPLINQFGKLQHQISAPPQPALIPLHFVEMPKTQLLLPGPFGGFDPDSGDYVIRLEPGEELPAAWLNVHSSPLYRETVDDMGFHTPLHERVWLHLSDDRSFSPWNSSLPRMIRMGTGITEWNAWTNSLDIRLCAAGMPGYACGIRSLRIRNASDTHMKLTLCISARLGSQADTLVLLPDAIICNAANPQSFLAGEGWHFTRRDEVINGAPPATVQSDLPSGGTALLSRELDLPPQGSATSIWLSGFARHAEDIPNALAEIRTQGASSVLRSVREHWSQPLSRLAVSTPEESFDLLVNRILPMQALHENSLMAVLVRIYLKPEEARQLLLQHASDPICDWPLLSLILVQYAEVTGDEALLDAPFGRQGTLYNCCASALQSQMNCDFDSLPKDALLLCHAAEALERLRPNKALRELGVMLFRQIEIHHGNQCADTNVPMRDLALACLHHGANPQTKKRFLSVWEKMYDPLHGMIRSEENAASPLRPGLPDNGGMITLDAVLSMLALMRTDRTEDAFELMRALNPIHHTDDMNRASIFRCSPYLLHGGMCAAPMEAGRALPEDGADAAALLYFILLYRVLGIRRKGTQIQLHPQVPDDWEAFSFTIHEGTSTWHFSADQRGSAFILDGDVVKGNMITIADDGKVHQVRFPLTQA